MASLQAHLKYLRYVLRHKRFVYQEGRPLGVPVLQLLAHDFQKFLPVEWTPYVEKFYGTDPDSVKAQFDLAWLHHQKVGGKHHWQYWVLPKDDGSLKALPMPDRYRREMVADWRGAGRAILGHDDSLTWYTENRDRMVLHPDTRRWVDDVMGWTVRHG